MAVGARTPNRLLDGPQFFRSVNYGGSQEFLAFEDLWDPAFQANCQSKLEDFCRARADQETLKISSSGSFPSFELTQTRYEREMDWVSFTRQLTSNAPGKKQYVRFLLNRYHYNLGHINRRYGSEAKQWADLLEHPFIKIDHQNARIFEDDTAFLRILARKWSTDMQTMFGSVKTPIELDNTVWAQIAPFQTLRIGQSRFAIL